MLLYVTRHGKAQPDSPTGRDEDRALRKRGERQARWLGCRLADGSASPALILASRRVRARETARLVQEEVGCEIREEPTLDLGHDVSDVLDMIGRAAPEVGDGPLMIVGHNPQLELLVGVLTQGPVGMPARLRTGECACIRVGSADEFVGGGSLVEMLRLIEE